MTTDEKEIHAAVSQICYIQTGLLVLYKFAISLSCISTSAYGRNILVLCSAVNLGIVPDFCVPTFPHLVHYEGLFFLAVKGFHMATCLRVCYVLLIQTII